MTQQPIKLTDDVLGGIRDILHRSQLTTKNAELYFAAIRALRDRARAVVDSTATLTIKAKEPLAFTIVQDESLIDALREVLP